MTSGIQGCNLFILGHHEDVQATGEASSTRQGTSSTLKHEIFQFLLFLLVIFTLLDPFQLTKINADPDPQHCE